MKVIINIPEKFVNAAEQISILGGEDYKELFDRIRNATEPIDISDELHKAQNSKSEETQFLIGLVCMAMATVKEQKGGDE